AEVPGARLPQNPIRRIDRPRIDRRTKARYLDEAEESRLRPTLQTRDGEMARARVFANAWGQARHKPSLPPHFGDRLTAAVLLSMNTGLRRGELLKLRWSSVDFAHQLAHRGRPNIKDASDLARPTESRGNQRTHPVA